MRIRRWSLRFKLTLMSIIITSTMCVLLTLTSLFSADTMSSAMYTYPVDMMNQLTATTESSNNSMEAASVEATSVEATSIDVVGTIPTEQLQAELLVATQDAMYQFQSSTIYSMLILIVVATILTYYFAGKTLKPLEILNEEVKNRNVENLHEDIKLIHAEDEVEELTHSFNEMTTKIHQSYLMQKNFSSNAAHELRTPLTVIQTKLDVFSMKKRTPEEYDGFLQVLRENVERLSDIIKSLLEFTNETEIEFSEKVKIKEIIEEVVFELEDKAAEKDIEVSIDCQIECLKGNDGLLQQVVYNLVDNAIKYNKMNGKVEVKTRSFKQGVLLEVRDRGIGIAEHDRKNIFEPFVRVDESRNRDIAGSGLGLSIVKNIVEKHGGCIQISDVEDGGTCFSVYFYDKK